MENYSASWLSQIPRAPTDAMFGLSAAYRADDNPSKVDLGVGAYRDENAEPWILPSVQNAKELLSRSRELNHEYLPIEGLAPYLSASQRLMFGDNSKGILEQRVASVQTISGTNALHLGALFLSRFYPDSPAKKVYLSNPPYVNHMPIFGHVGLEIGSYPYYSPMTKSLEFDSLINTIKSLPHKSIILLHTCAHNPTGVDPNEDQWKQIAAVMKARHQVPFFDSAYQGFASGDTDRDAWPVRHFIEQGFDLVLVAQSYAKNFGLYGERVGCLHVVAPSTEIANNVFSQLRRLQRVDISTPPAYGARIVSTILNDTDLMKQWHEDLKTMSGRILDMRNALRSQLESNGAVGSWDHITQQTGMFCYSGLTATQVEVLSKQWHIYLTPDGRISVSGLNSRNIDYVGRAIIEVTRQNE